MGAASKKALEKSAKAGDADQFREWHGSGSIKDVNAALNGPKETALHLAAIGGHVDLARWLVVQGGANVNATAKNGNTPLHLAAFHGSEPVARVLVTEGGADPNAVSNGDVVPVYFAAQNGHLAIVEFLVNTAESDVGPTTPGATPLRAAVDGAQQECVDFLARKTRVRETVDDAEPDGTTALHTAVIIGRLGIVEALVKHAGAGIDVANPKNGWAPLHYAAHRGHVEIADFLIAEGADPNARAKDLSTPLHVAASAGQVAIVASLCAREENVAVNVNALDSRGGTALHTAVRFGHSEVISCLLKDGVIDTDVRDRKGKTAGDHAKKLELGGILGLLEDAPPAKRQRKG